MERSLSHAAGLALKRDTIERQAKALTKTQRAKLKSLSDDWRQEEHDWKAGAVFHRLADMGLCEMEDRRVAGGDVFTGPGNTSAYRWFTRRTKAGSAVLSAVID